MLGRSFKFEQLARLATEECQRRPDVPLEFTLMKGSGPLILPVVELNSTTNLGQGAGSDAALQADDTTMDFQVSCNQAVSPQLCDLGCTEL